jgi:hypothetical protein
MMNVEPRFITPAQHNFIVCNPAPTIILEDFPHITMVLPPPGVEGPVVNYPLNADTVLRGGYSVLYTHPDRPEQVPRPWEEYKPALQVERRIFKRLGEHPNLVKVIEMDE